MMHLTTTVFAAVGMAAAPCLAAPIAGAPNWFEGRSQYGGNIVPHVLDVPTGDKKIAPHLLDAHTQDSTAIDLIEPMVLPINMLHPRELEQSADNFPPGSDEHKTSMSLPDQLKYQEKLKDFSNPRVTVWKKPSIVREDPRWSKPLTAEELKEAQYDATEENSTENETHKEDGTEYETTHENDIEYETAQEKTDTQDDENTSATPNYIDEDDTDVEREYAGPHKSDETDTYDEAKSQTFGKGKTETSWVKHEGAEDAEPETTEQADQVDYSQPIGWEDGDAEATHDEDAVPDTTEKTDEVDYSQPIGWEDSDADVTQEGGTESKPVDEADEVDYSQPIGWEDVDADVTQEEEADEESPSRPISMGYTKPESEDFEPKAQHPKSDTRSDDEDSGDEYKHPVRNQIEDMIGPELIGHAEEHLDSYDWDSMPLDYQMNHSKTSTVNGEAQDI